MKKIKITFAILVLSFFFVGSSHSQELSYLYEDLAREWAEFYSEEKLYFIKSVNDVYFEECKFQNKNKKEQMSLAEKVLDRALQIRGIDKEIKNSATKGFKYGFRKSRTRSMEGYYSSKSEFCDCLHSVSAMNEPSCLNKK